MPKGPQSRANRNSSPESFRWKPPRPHKLKIPIAPSTRLRMLPDRIVHLFSGRGAAVSIFGSLEMPINTASNNKCDANHGVWHLDRCRFLHAVHLQSLRRELPQLFHCQRRRAQDQQSTDFRGDRGAERVEGLGQIQPARCRFRLCLTQST